MKFAAKRVLPLVIALVARTLLWPPAVCVKDVNLSADTHKLNKVW